ncbi:MAG: tail fiber domain-containing protein [Bacteroidaceae bacterium]|nr:tail fiber domain-containing protein [Bacteroidaceae bacterium]
MKKIFTLFIAAMYAAGVFAQLVVEETGKVAVGYEGTSPIVSDFAVNSEGLSTATAHIKSQGNTYGLYVDESLEEVPTPAKSDPDDPKSPPVYNQYGVYSQTTPIEYSYAYGLYGKSCSSSSLTWGRTFGLYGIAGYGKAGYNYGVFGTLQGTRDGAGVYGSSVSGDNGYDVGGRYAGFFRGDVSATGSIIGTIVNRSDYRLKKNIQYLSDTQQSLEQVMLMNPIEFNYINRQMGEDEDGNPVYMYQGDEPTYTHKHFGLIAQELRDIFPNLVYEGVAGNGYLSIAYVELVPVLIRAIQELKCQLDEAKTGGRISEGDTTPSDAPGMRLMQTELFQNTPNPFNEKTEIPCTIAEGVKKATLYVYDMSGKQLSEYPIDARGKTAVTIEGGSLDAGMYLYSLIADGKVIDTKRMILTK